MPAQTPVRPQALTLLARLIERNHQIAAGEVGEGDGTFAVLPAGGDISPVQQLRESLIDSFVIAGGGFAIEPVICSVPGVKAGTMTANVLEAESLPCNHCSMTSEK